MKWFNNSSLFTKLLIGNGLVAMVALSICYLAASGISFFIVSVTAIVTLAIGISVFLNSKISRPLQLTADYIEMIARGNTPPKITATCYGIFNDIKNSLNNYIDEISALVDETGVVMKIVQEGQLTFRANPNRTNGVYRKILRGINEILDAIADPMDEARIVLGKMAFNDHTLEMRGQYQGQFKELFEGINLVRTRLLAIQDIFISISKGEVRYLDKYREIGKRSENDTLIPAIIVTIQAISDLITESKFLTNAAREGRLETRGNAEVFNGGFREIVEGINSTLDAVIGPLNLTAVYVDRISKGDIPPKISDNYSGDFNVIKNNLNACIDGLGGLVESSKVLDRMAVNDYGLRVEGQYQGIFADTGRSVNDVRERLVTVTAINNRIARGDFSDYESLKQIGRRSAEDQLLPSLVQMIENLRRLIADADMLARAAVEGKLDIRADINQHSGEFKTVVEGINATLDAVIAPIKEASAVLNEMAEGNLRVSVTGNYLGDHAEIKNALNHTLQSLNEVLGEIHQASEQIAAGAGQVSDSSQSLSQASTEQASSTEEITATMTQVDSQTKQNAINANQANDLAGVAKSNAILGDHEMQEMLKAMGEINDASTNISKIIKVIDEIAFQTNILALNAAVEAARAGQHGKGFAVVAEEVRNLAARSANAAKETTVMIEGSINKVSMGTKMANETAGALNKIVTGVTTVADLVGDIASASNEQAIAIAQVNQGIAGVSEVTQMNTATAQQSAAASEELASQAELLKDQVNKFKIQKKHSSFNRFNEISPDMIKIIEGIMKNNYATQVDSTENHKEPSPRSKAKIALDEGDFGKY